MKLRILVIAGVVLMGAGLIATYEMQEPVEDNSTLRPNEPQSPSSPSAAPAPNR